MYWQILSILRLGSNQFTTAGFTVYTYYEYITEKHKDLVVVSSFQDTVYKDKYISKQDSQFTVKCNTEARSRYHCYRGKKQVLHNLSVCFNLSYLVRKADAPYHVLSVTCPALPYFSTLFHKRQGFREKKLLNML
jgi:hypothetical protein